MCYDVIDGTGKRNEQRRKVQNSKFCSFQTSLFWFWQCTFKKIWMNVNFPQIRNYAHEEIGYGKVPPKMKGPKVFSPKIKRARNIPSTPAMLWLLPLVSSAAPAGNDTFSKAINFWCSLWLNPSSCSTFVAGAVVFRFAVFSSSALSNSEVAVDDSLFESRECFRCGFCCNSFVVCSIITISVHSAVFICNFSKQMFTLFKFIFINVFITLTLRHFIISYSDS